MECRACLSSKLVLLLMILIVALLSYKAFWVQKVTTPITQLTQQGDNDTPSTPPTINTQEINLLIQEYIINHPEDIIRSLEVIQKQKLKAMQDEAEQNIQKNLEAIEDATNAPVQGNNEGSINITYFYDYNCNYCIKASQVFDQIIQDNPQIKLVYKPLPYLGEGSEYIARIILAVNKLAPSKLKTLHDILLTSQINSAQEILELLQKHEIDGTAVVELANSKEIQTTLQRNLELAKSIKINGVPVYVINGKYYAGVIRKGQIQDIINAIDTDTKTSQLKTEPNNAAD